MDGLQVAYVGSDNKNRKIMGICEVDEQSASVKDDPILKWQVPNSWTSENAISVPLHYGLVRIFLMLKID